MHFTDAEVGLYARLLCVQWSTGSLPDDDTELASYGKGDTALGRIKSKFVKGADGRLRNLRMETERQKQLDFRARQTLNGLRGGRPSKPKPNPSVSSGLSQTEAKKSSPVSVSVSVSGLLSPSPDSGIAPNKLARERNPLFDTLAEVCGCIPHQLTKRAASACGVALAEIRAVCPALTPDEIKRRAAVYRQKFPRMSITPSQLCSMWAQLDNGTTQGAGRDAPLKPLMR